MTIEAALLTSAFTILCIVVTYITTIKKNNREAEKLAAETHKLHLEAQQKEVEVSESINEYYRTEMKNMLVEMAKLQLQVQALSDEVKALSTVVAEKDKHIVTLVEKCDAYEKKLRFQIAAAKGCINRKPNQKCAVLDVEI